MRKETEVDIFKWRESLKVKPFCFVYNAYKSLRNNPDPSVEIEYMGLVTGNVLASRPIGQRLRGFYALLRQRRYALKEEKYERIRELESEIWEFNMHILG